ncbi:ACT domain-containing protein [Embleya scabrispora]|uniref:ACT domain-containing protein n=1 Tax=Embleya scabrispora TaxID=159449 RepID=UPI0003A6A945|nr:ACT domain-containing protein [Embleya scabrispora]MYS84605.1 ACT domain-containing protein [Streptomyces sp. SID5474]
MRSTAPCVNLRLLPESYAVCRLDPAGEHRLPAAGSGSLYCLTRTPEELSLVCVENLVPPDVEVEREWSAMVVAGPLDFSLTGILASIAGPLAEAGIPLFAVSTYDTDYVLVKSDRARDAIAVLGAAGHTIVNE